MESIIESTQQRLSGEAALQRLLFLAGRADDNNTATAAAKAALRLIQLSGNTHRYKEVFHNHLLRDNNHAQPDTTWLHETEHNNRHARSVLVSRLQSAQAHLNKEAIRMAYLALAEHDEKTGDLTEAFHSVMRAKDYCTSRQQTIQVSLQILTTALHLKNYHTVKEYVTKLEHTLGRKNESPGDNSDDSMIRNKVLAVSALERLHNADYDKAARLFRTVAATATDTSEESWWSTVLSAEEVAFYASMLTAAVGTRREMVTLAEHSEALELVPPLREALLQFGQRADYGKCWKILSESVFPILQVDMYMSSHLAVLQQKIREKCILRYWQPYQRVEVAVMAAQLGSGLVPSTDELLKTMVDLISSGLITDTRIDMLHQTIVREEDDPEQARLHQTASKLSSVSQTVLDDTYSMVIRLACLEHDLCVADPAAASHKRRGGPAYGLRSGAAFDLSGGSSVEIMGMDDSSDDEPDHPMIDVADGMNPEDLY